MPQTDPVATLARQRKISLAAELEAELHSKGFSPVLAVWKALKERAAESLAGLVWCNPFDPAELGKIATLQNEVKRYDEFVGVLRDIIQEGEHLDAEMDDQERQELLDLLMAQGNEAGIREAAALGLIDVGPPDA